MVQHVVAKFKEETSEQERAEIVATQRTLPGKIAKSKD